MEKTIEIPEGYEARIEGNKVILERKESEDERIREVIESIVRVYGKTQGEWLAGYDMDTLVVHLRDAFAYLEKQKEQKPAEKISVSEELYEHIRNTCACIEDAMSSDTMCDMTDYLEMADKSAQAAFDMLEKQMPTEWGNTDMKEARNNLISVCRDWERGEKTTLLPIVAIRARYFLEHLTEPKPAEWSEEDKKMIDDIIYCLPRMAMGNIEMLPSVAEQYAQRLKSLHPSWKPSREQLLALKEQTNWLSKTNPLHSLYYQLCEL